MINVPEAEKIAWQSGTQKNLRIVFDDGMTIENDDIFSESMTLEQTLSDEQNIKYGKCSSACFTVKIADTSVSLKGKKFTAVLKCGEYSRNLGIFTVFTDNRTDDRKYKEIVAYDAIYKLSTIDCTAWYKGLTFPMTLKSFRDSFFSHVGIVQETKVLPNDSLQIEKTIDPSSISGLAIAESICELNARFGQIGSDGKFRYVSIGNNLDALYPRNDLFPAEDLYPRDNVNFTLTTDDYSQGSLVYEDYTTQKVTKVVVREQEGDVGGSAGTGENIYYVTGNFLAYGQSQENLSSIASNIYKEIENVSYHPSRVTTMSYLPFAEVGDLVRVIGVTDTISFPILKRSISGITGAKETYSASGTETMSENSSTIADEIIQLKGRSNVLKRTIDETQSTITRLEENVDGEVERLQTQITQNATDITLEATRATGAESALSGRITVNADNITSEVTRATGAESALSGRITVNADNITSEVTRATGAESALSGQITVNADNITSEVTRATGAESALSGRITVNADNITSEVTRATGAESALSGQITVNADNITSEVTRATGAESALSGRITVNADNITSEVTRATGAESALSGRITVNADNITSEVTRATGAESALSGQITVNADNITSEVTRATGAESALSGRITVNADNITSEVTRATGAESALSGRITVNADNITSEVTRATGAESALSGRITVNADNITSEVTRATGAESALSGRITVNADNITSEVTRATGAESALSGRITVNADNITSEVTRATGAEGALSGRITVNAENISSEVTRATEAEGTLSSRISQSAHEISLSVSGSVGKGSSAGITISLLDEKGNVIDSGNGNITLDGNVVFKSDLTDGTTQISGDNIKTGTISANRIDVDGIFAKNIKATGTITGAELIGSEISTKSTSTNGQIIIKDGSVKSFSYGGDTRIVLNNAGLQFYSYDGIRTGWMHGGLSGGTAVLMIGDYNFSSEPQIQGSVLSSLFLPLIGGTMTGNITTPANDNYGIVPATTNYGQVGSSDYHYYRSYINNMYTNDISLTSTETRATSAKSIYSYLNDGKYAKSIVKNATAVTVAQNTVTDLTTYKFAPGYWIIQCSALYDSVPYSGYVELFLSTTKNSTTGSDRYTSDTRYSGASHNIRCQFTTVKHITEETELHLCARHDKTRSVSVTGGIIAMKIGEK